MARDLDLRQLLGTLAAHRVDYVLIGGMAAAAQVINRIAGA